jgi:hypothetical protein
MNALVNFVLAVVVAIVTILVVALIFFMNAETDTTVSEIGKWRALWAFLIGFTIAATLLMT